MYELLMLCCLGCMITFVCPIWNKLHFFMGCICFSSLTHSSLLLVQTLQQQQVDLQNQLHTELKDQLRTTTAQLQQQLQQQEQVDANAQAHIASLTATNMTLTARNTQLEERLRHSELRFVPACVI